VLTPQSGYVLKPLALRDFGIKFNPIDPKYFAIF
jgi:hypothetical protein